MCACRSQGWQKNISPCCKQAIPEHVIAFNSFKLSWGTSIGVTALCCGLAANASHASANMWYARKTGMTTHVLRCEPTQTGPFICESNFVQSGWKWDWGSLWPSEPLASFLSFHKAVAKSKGFYRDRLWDGWAAPGFCSRSGSGDFQALPQMCLRREFSFNALTQRSDCSAGQLDTQCKWPWGNTQMSLTGWQRCSKPGLKCL